MESHRVNGLFNLGSLKQPAVFLAITDARVRANFLSVYFEIWFALFSNYRNLRIIPLAKLCSQKKKIDISRYTGSKKYLETGKLSLTQGCAR